MDRTLEILINKLVDSGQCPEDILGYEDFIEDYCKHDSHHITCVNCWKAYTEQYVSGVSESKYRPFRPEEALIYIDKSVYQNNILYGVIKSVSNKGFYINTLSASLVFIGDFKWCCEHLKFEDGNPVGVLVYKNQNPSKNIQATD